MGNVANIASILSIVIDIRFFQAAATIIPTLFIALAIASKVFDPAVNTRGPRDDLSPHNIGNVKATNVFFIGIATAEALAMCVLAFNTPNILAFTYIFALCVAATWTVCMITLRPLLELHSQRKSRKRTELLAVFVVLSISLSFVAFSLA